MSLSVGERIKNVGLGFERQPSPERSLKMKQFFLPLKVFVVGMILVGVLMWIWPSIVDPAVSSLAANSTGWAANPHAWGWSWLMSTGVVRWIAFAIGFLTVCFITGLVFIRQRTQF